MNSIKGLIVKDFQTIKSYKSTIIYMLILFVGAAFLNNEITIFLPIFMPLVFGMLGISSFSYDNLAKADKYILTFPVDKKDIVKARYVYILLVTLFGFIFGFALTFLVHLIKTKGAMDIELIGNALATAVGGLLGIVFLQSFQTPIMYKYGSEKGRIIQMIMIVVLMVGISVITTTLMKVFEISLDSFAVMLKEYLIAIIGVFIIVIFGVSYFISCKIYQNKDI